MKNIIKKMFLVTFKTIDGTLSILLREEEIDNLSAQDYIKSTGYNDCWFDGSCWQAKNAKGNLVTIKQGDGEISARIPNI